MENLLTILLRYISMSLGWLYFLFNRIDLDPVCVDTTKKNIQKYYDGDNWDCRQISVFDLDPDKIGVFDIKVL